MDEYSIKTMAWLDSRFRRVDNEGIYFAHQPIYGFRVGHCEPLLLDRYIRTIRILKCLSKYNVRHLLDVGAAEGYKAALAQKLLGVAHVECCDLSAEAGKRTEEIFKIKSCQADIHQLPYKDRQFDAVICSETLEHVTDVHKAVRELARVANKVIIITVPNETSECVEENRERQTMHGHINAFDEATLSYVSAEGWNVCHEGIMSHYLKYLRTLADAEVVHSSKGRLSVRCAIQLYNVSRPLIRPLCNRYVVAACIWFDRLVLRAANKYDAHLYCLSRRDGKEKPVRGNRVSILDVLNFSVPLHRL